jgi:hypothetical protein
MKFFQNTDTVDIAAKSVGISCNQMLDDRGLHIQIKHNGTHFKIANKMAKIIVDALNEFKIGNVPLVVVFRKFDGGDIIALFPHEDYNNDGSLCLSYQHVGQHAGADYNACMKITVPATEQEYKPLLNELVKIGYDLKVQKRK